MRDNESPLKVAAGGFDLIGDLHGHAGPLHRMLARLGYRERGGCYCHPDRKVVFLGDYIDRGPSVREVLRVVRSMVDSGAALAVMGNHEFNALCYHSPDGAGGYLRPHSEKNVAQHRASLDAFADHPDEWRDHLAWFKRLPLYLNMPGFRVVHACWDEAHVAAVNGGGRLDEARLLRAACRGSLEHAAVECLIKGPELRLPKGCRFVDPDGAFRSKIRVRWWLPAAGRSYRELAIPASERVVALPVPSELVAGFNGYPAEAPPVFLGHYWMLPGRLAPLAPNVGCLDYSVAKGGPLVAYRWNGEGALSEEGFVAAE